MVRVRPGSRALKGDTFERPISNPQWL